MDNAILDIKRTPGGQELLGALREWIETLQLTLDLDTDPTHSGEIGILLGKIRAYRGLEELLLAEPAETTEE